MVVLMDTLKAGKLDKLKVVQPADMKGKWMVGRKVV